MVITSLSGSYYKSSSDLTHFYVVGDTGLDIINKTTELSEGFIAFPSGFNDVWAEDNTFVYMASDDGLYVLEKPSTFQVGEDLTSKLYKDSRSEYLQSQEILALHGRTRADLVLGTTSGVEVFSLGSVYHSNEFNPVTSVHMTETLDILYGGGFGLGVKKAPIASNWSSAQFHLTEPFISNNNVTGLDSVTVSGDTVLGIATSSGINLIQQRDPLVVSPTIKYFVSN